MEKIIMSEAKKIRKRGCSPTSSTTSSVIQNSRFKRAILVGKRGKGGSSSTPVPTWRMVGPPRSPSVVLRSAAVQSPRYPPSFSGRSKSGQQGQPVSARKLAATLWEMNEVPSPSQSQSQSSANGSVRRREKERRRRRRESGVFPPHLSDPSHSPVSDRMERSGTGSHRRRDSSTSRRIRIDNFDSASRASFMEIDTRSRCQTPSGSTVGAKSRLKDVSNALMTSKELLKIISRMWGHEGQPSSSMSLISALHAELERARLQINELIQEEHSDHKGINYLLKRLEEEKAAWKNKEQEVVEAAVETIAGELEAERKVRRRSESLNKKLGKELAETKAAFLKAVMELENEKRTREVIEKESLRMQEEVEKERQMLHIAEALREERTHMKLSDAKLQFEEKNAMVDKLRNELEDILRTSSSSSKENGHGPVYHRRDGDMAFCQREANQDDAGEVEDMTDGENCAESDLHPLGLNRHNSSKNLKSFYASMTPRHSKQFSVDEGQPKVRKSIVSQVARRSTSLLRSVSDVVKWGNGSSNDTDKHIARRSCGDEIQKLKSSKNPREHALPSSRLGFDRECPSPSSQRGPPWPSRNPCDVGLQRPSTMEGMQGPDEGRIEGHNLRRSKR